ncbi:MAG: 7-cyano-7-deazaguanine synthase, partial [Eggerthellaceae bacterium]|nr:7-cyano-7-deazaguanine synthase [Eggerthellaceae bacterium]
MTQADNRAAGQAVGAEALHDFLARERRFAVAFSGGCDSACLLAAAHLAGCEVKAYLVKTAFQAAFELDDARAVIERLGIPFELIELDIFADDEDRREVCANPPDRCYLCKRLIFSTAWQHARRDGFEVLADGTNAKLGRSIHNVDITDLNFVRNCGANHIQGEESAAVYLKHISNCAFRDNIVDY